jgi:hypothetical protein
MWMRCNLGQTHGFDIQSPQPPPASADVASARLAGLIGFFSKDKKKGHGIFAKTLSSVT